MPVVAIFDCTDGIDQSNTIIFRVSRRSRPMKSIGFKSSIIFQLMEAKNNRYVFRLFYLQFSFLRNLTLDI